MKKIAGLPQVWILIGVFILSRLITWALGLNLNLWALSAYWQYLDLDTLQHHLLTGIWYDHTQPPAFNLLLGIILKTGGGNSVWLFTILLKLISLVNGLLLFSILKKTISIEFLPLIVSLAYLLSPATLVFECELFYTTFISMLLLISVLCMIRLSDQGRGADAFGVIFPLVLLCLTRSVYHIAWMFIVVAILLYYHQRKKILNNVILISLAGLLVVGSWYLKNKIIFGKLTTSTWMGMNLARNVFHDNEIKDSSRIEAYEPFSRVSDYRKFTDPQFENKYRGLNDRDLLQEYKNDSFMNLKEVSYIPVSDLYMKASVAHIKAHPVDYGKNILQSSILYFTPATMYSLAMEQSDKIIYLDVPYSFNLVHFSHSKGQRRILLTLSAIPKLLLYVCVFLFFIRYSFRTKTLQPWNLFIVLTIAFVFVVSSLFEHYENMRFRFETEPLFMILAAQVLSILYNRYKKSKNPKESRAGMR